MNSIAFELPSSVAWRAAKSAGLTLGEYLEVGLGFDWNTARGDLDLGFCRIHPDKISDQSLVDAVHAGNNLPRELLRKTWNPTTRSYTKPIYFCPDCLQHENGAAPWAWRTRVVSCCPLHERFLVGGCSECGEVFRYRMGLSRHGSIHWLDQWRYCPCCGIETRSGERAPKWLSNEVSKLHADSASVEMCRLALKLTLALEANPSVLRDCAIGLRLPANCDLVATVAAAILVVLRPVILSNASVSEEITFFALTGHPLSRAFPNTLTSLLNICGTHDASNEVSELTKFQLNS